MMNTLDHRKTAGNKCAKNGVMQFSSNWENNSWTQYGRSYAKSRSLMFITYEEMADKNNIHATSNSDARPPARRANNALHARNSAARHHMTVTQIPGNPSTRGMVLQHISSSVSRTRSFPAQQLCNVTHPVLLSRTGLQCY